MNAFPVQPGLMLLRRIAPIEIEVPARVDNFENALELLTVVH